MGKLIIAHGSRHRARQLRDYFRRMRHGDEAALIREREGDDNVEYQEWSRSYLAEADHRDEPEFDLHTRLLASLHGWQEVNVSDGVDPMVWGRLESFLSLSPPPLEESEPPEPLPSDDLVAYLHDYFTAFRDPKVNAREMIGISARDVRRLMDFRSREPWRDEAMDNALAMVLMMEPFWLRPLKDWEMPESCDRHTFASLLRHLFVLYPVPDFLLGDLWFNYYALPKWKWVMWLVLLGSGASLPRAGRVLGWWANTAFANALFDCGEMPAPEDACLIAEVLRKGGTRALAEAFMMDDAFHIDPTAVIEAAPANEWQQGREDEFREFWGLTMDWMIRHQAALPHEELSFILAWARYEFIGRRERGSHFTWKGRTPAAALRSAARYAATQPELMLLRSSWQDHNWNWTLTDDGGAVWSLSELTTGYAMIEEGKAMRHCVGGYITGCQEGDHAVFSLRKNGDRALTISVYLPSRQIGHALGVYNRQPRADELGVVNRWCEEVLKSIPPQ